MSQVDSENSIALPAGAAGAIRSGLAIQQRLRETALYDLARLRREARDEIARLISFLDASDPYAQFELEEQDDREAEIAEPSLGGLDRAQDQTRWAAGGTDDAELDRSDDEPSVGSGDGWSGEHASQENWARGGRDDREDDPTESGIADHDGLLEQIGRWDWQHTVMA